MLRRCPVFLAGWGNFSHRYGGKSGFHADNTDDQAESRQSRKYKAEAQRQAEAEAEAEREREEEPGDEWESGNEELEPEYMKLMEAYKIFEYRLGDKIEAGELRKRFKKLALKKHPDQGGSEELFRELIDAQKLMLEARHDKSTHKKSGRKKEPRENPPPEYDWKMKADLLHVNEVESAAEWALGRNFDFIVVFCTIFFLYFAWDKRMQRRVIMISQTRGRMDQEDMAPKPEVIYKPRGEWHAWRANNADLQRLQQTKDWARPELTVDERRRQLKAGTLEVAPLPGTWDAFKFSEKKENAEADAWNALADAAIARGEVPLVT